MNIREAEQRGYRYVTSVAIACPGSFALENWESDKKAAAKLKREYEGADYAVIQGSANDWLGRGYKALYGNKTFVRLWRALVEPHNSPEETIETLSERKRSIQEECELELREVDESIAVQRELRKWIDSLKK